MTAGMLRILQTLILPLLVWSEAPSTGKGCRCRPSDACWPSAAEWDRLNTTLHGNLLALRPLASVCHGDEYDADACENVKLHTNDSSWRSDQPAAVEWQNWEAWADEHETCYVQSKRAVPCRQGRVSLYSVQAQSASDVQAGVRFARTHNLRLAVRNTGHDFAGRSSAAESMQINTHHLTDKTYIKNFIPAGSSKGRGRAVTLGAGVQLYDMYKWLSKHGIMVVGGSSHNVGVAGGYIQGGGHSVLGAYKGMAVDHALEFTIVTADGQHVCANAYQNPDLFWALRGGGGGTWGVVTSVTLQAFDDPPMVSFEFRGGTAAGDENYWKILERFHEFLPKFNDAGGNMYYFMLPNLTEPTLGQVSALAAVGGFGGQSDKSKVDKLMKPLMEEFGKLAATPFNYSSTAAKASDWYLESYKTPDSTGALAILGSRIITRDFMTQPDGPRKFTDAIRSLRADPTTQLQGLVVAGPAVAANTDKVDCALHPVWRKALVEFIVPRGWTPNTPLAVQKAIQRNVTEVEVPIFKALEPGKGGGTYLNEADGYEQDFQDSFWGVHYPRLYKIKQKWDPDNLFIVRRGVGSEDWDEEGLCRK